MSYFETTHQEDPLDWSLRKLTENGFEQVHRGEENSKKNQSKEILKAFEGFRIPPQETIPREKQNLKNENTEKQSQIEGELGTSIKEFIELLQFEEAIPQSRPKIEIKYTPSSEMNRINETKDFPEKPKILLPPKGPANLNIPFRPLSPPCVTDSQLLSNDDFKKIEELLSKYKSTF